VNENFKKIYINVGCVLSKECLKTLYYWLGHICIYALFLKDINVFQSNVAVWILYITPSLKKKIHIDLLQFIY